MYRVISPLPRDAAEMTAGHQRKEEIDFFTQGSESRLKPAATHTEQADESIALPHQLDQHPDLGHQLSEVSDGPEDVRADEVLAAVGLRGRSSEMVRCCQEADVDATSHEAKAHLIFHPLVFTTPARNE